MMPSPSQTAHQSSVRPPATFFWVGAADVGGASRAIDCSAMRSNLRGKIRQKLLVYKNSRLLFFCAFREQVFERPPGRVIAAKAVDTPAGRGGGGTEIETPGRGAVGTGSQRRPGEELPDVDCAADDVAADIIRIVGFERSGVHSMPGEDTIFKAGSEAFDLLLDGLGVVEDRAIGNVTINPHDVPAHRRAGWIK